MEKEIAVVRQIQPRELHRKLSAGDPVYLVDVRQPWEHELAALPDSLLIPLNQLATSFATISPPRDSLVVAYCHHGIRSLSAAALLEKLGLESVSSLSGGIDAWSIEIDPSVPRY
jgi:rhodanese-related sulfurtransferase